jgi:hypothetical protein
MSMGYFFVEESRDIEVHAMYLFLCVILRYSYGDGGLHVQHVSHE